MSYVQPNFLYCSVNMRRVYSQQVPVLSQLTSVLERLLKSGSSVASNTTGNEFSVDEIAFSGGMRMGNKKRKKREALKKAHSQFQV